MANLAYNRVIHSRVAFGLCVAILAGACTSSSTTTTDPSPAKCQVSLTNSSPTMDSGGGQGSVTVTAQAECGWGPAAVDRDWVSFPSSASGQGSGKVDYRVSANSGPSTRRATITINGQTVTVDQAGSSSGCSISLTTPGQSVAASGSNGTVGVTAAASCSWPVVSNVGWISITSGTSGTGNGTVAFTVAPNTGGARSGTLTIGGQTFTVAQSGGSSPGPCTYTLGSLTQGIPSGGGSGSVTVTTGATCAWTATSNATWITIISGSTGTGDGTVAYNVAPNSGGARSGTLTIASQTYTVTQPAASSPSCAYTVTPMSQTVSAAGGNGTQLVVQTPLECAWSSASNDSWITNVAGGGSGPGVVNFTAAANTGPARTGHLTVADKSIAVMQSDGCAPSIQPSSQNIGSGGGAGGPVTVQVDPGCGWNAASNDSWITNVNPASGSGQGTVTFTVAANSGPARTGTLTIAGRTFTVMQADGCTLSIQPSSQNIGSGGGSGGPVGVTAPGGCGWSAASNDSWITNVNPTSGTGSGTVTFTVAANSGSARNGTLTIAGQTFTVMQAGGCSPNIQQTSQNIGAGGGQGGPVNVIAGSGCGWTAASNDSWITSVNPTSGTGNGTVTFTVAANSGPARNGTLTIAGQTFTVMQASGCAPTIQPSSQSAGSAGGAGTPVAVMAPGGCAWTAGSNAPWLTNVNPTGGSGNGTVNFTIGANTGTSRSGTLTIATHMFTVNQDGCTYNLTPTSQTFNHNGGSGSVNVVPNGGCAWSWMTTLDAGSTWIHISGGSGSGPGVVNYTVDPTTQMRTGGMTIAGVHFTVTQTLVP